MNGTYICVDSHSTIKHDESCYGHKQVDNLVNSHCCYLLLTQTPYSSALRKPQIPFRFFSYLFAEQFASINMADRMDAKQDPKGFVQPDFDDTDCYRAMWSRPDDPFWGDKNKMEEQRKNFIIQPYWHSLDRYFPPAVFRIKGLRRFIPHPDSTELMMNKSRGVHCVDGTGREFSCHKSNILPAFMYQ